MRDPLGHGAALKGRVGFRHHFYTGHPRTVTVVMPSVVNPKGRTKRLKSIQETWGASARAIYVVHDIEEFPVASHAVISESRTPEDPYSYPQLMLVPDGIGAEDGVPRLIHTVQTVFEKVNPDFAFFVNDHTYVIPEHLCNYLEHKKPTEDMYHGHALHDGNNAFNSGAAGYILSRETMRRLVDQWNHGKCTGRDASKWIQGNPGLLTAQCLKEDLGITAFDTRQDKKYHRFHAFPLTRAVSGKVDGWYINKHKDMDKNFMGFPASYNTLLSGKDCCAQDTVSFHYVEFMESTALFATREALLENPHMTDHEVKSLMMAEWPRGKEVGFYSRELPSENDKEGWEPLLKVVRKISSRLTQREC
ncbi:unnamed protein product [Pseudo-nitzschia multistriata]|uniref:Uncharacterized protein n=1 Tax=Pseudo-nitzschia multistriata TaxID=183589 RepID=A0A448YUP3_9STRA|nr:unnamed protein product [Pseudo-nitzschia multistriata]